MAAILEKGEMVIPNDARYSVKSQENRGTVNINVSAIDAQGTYQFLNNNKRAIASMLQGVHKDNHPSRRENL